MKLSLRFKSLTITILGLIFSSFLIFYLSEKYIITDFIYLEKHDATQNAQRVEEALNSDLQSLDDKTGDWANWDDAYDFAENGNAEFIKENPTNRAFSEININLMMFINNSGQVLYAKGYDLTAQKEASPSASILGLASDDTLINHPDLKKSVKGIVNLPEGPLLVSAHPILNSDGIGPSRGTLIFGRFLDKVELNKLSKTTHINLTFDDLDIFQNKKGPILITPQNSQVINGWLQLKDIHDQPVVVIKETLPRQIYQQGRATVFNLLAWIIGISVALGLIRIIVLERLVLSPVTKLAKEVNEIGLKANLAGRVKLTGSDELGKLGSGINTMLELLQTSQFKRQEAEHQLSLSHGQLQEKILELQRINNLMVGRELRMIELKKEIDDLKGEGLDKKI